MMTKERKIKMAKAALMNGDDALAQKLVSELDSGAGLTLRKKDAKPSQQKTRQFHIR